MARNGKKMARHALRAEMARHALRAASSTWNGKTRIARRVVNMGIAAWRTMARHASSVRVFQQTIAIYRRLCVQPLRRQRLTIIKGYAYIDSDPKNHSLIARRVVNMGIAAWCMRPFLTSPTTIREISVVP
jgi:hypothetical protein